MFGFIFRSAFRSYRKNLLFTSINFIGLTLGMASFVLLGLYVIRERSFDKHWSKGDRIYRISREFFSKDGSTTLHLGHLAPPFAPLFKVDFEEQCEEVVRLKRNWGGTTKYQENLFSEDKFYYADPEFFSVFDIPFVKGDQTSALTHPNSVVISESTAERIFGDEDPMEKLLEGNDGMNLVVRGVFQDIPTNSHFHLDLVADFSIIEGLYGGRERMMKNFGSNNFSTFILLKEGHTIEEVTSQMPDFLVKHLNEKANEWNALHAMNVKDIHLESHLDTEIEANGDSKIVWTFASIAVLVLILACINYINLSLARAGDRAKEVGVRKTIGASRGEISIQFLTESFILAFVACALGLFIARFSAPIILAYTGIELHFDLNKSILWILLFGLFSIGIGLVAGLYPSLILSAFKPSKVLKGDLRLFNSGVRLKEVLVVFQFAIAAFLIFSTTIIFQQLQFLEDKSLGYDKENIMILPVDDVLNEKVELAYDRVRRVKGVISATGGNIFPTNRLLNSGGASVEFGDTMMIPEVVIKAVSTDYNYFETFGVEIVAGRDFSKDFLTDDTMAFVLNRNATEMIGWSDPNEAIGKAFTYWGREGKIVGVVEDFHMESLHSPISPVVFIIDVNRVNQMAVRFSGTDPMALKDELQNIWVEMAPDLPFDYWFLDDQYVELYDSEQARGKLFSLFSFLSIVIAGLGLLGLTIYYLSQKLKEVSLRKVLGSNVSQLFYFVSSHFLKLILISFAVGIPMGWYFSNIWLENFAYHIEIGPDAAFLSIVLSLFLALLPLIWTTYRASRVNPIVWLKDE